MKENPVNCKPLLALLALLALATVGLAIASATSQATEGATPRSWEVVIKHGQFLVDGKKQPLTIGAGDQVAWVNEDTMVHTATSVDGGRTFDTGNIPANGGRSKVITF